MPLYHFVAKPSGFCVERGYGAALTVELEPWALSLRHEEYPVRRCSFYEGDQLATLIAARLLGEDDATAGADRPFTPPRQVIREAKTIGTDVGLQRLRLLAQVDPAVHQIQLLSLRTAGRVAPLAQEAALYHEPYILKDVLNHRAAAIALAYLQSDLWPPRVRLPDGSRYAGDAGGAGDLSARPAAARPAGSAVAEASEPQVTEFLDAMAHWRGLFSPDGRPYRSLNRTLMNLPRDVPGDLVCSLNRIRLERPVTHWLELTTLLLYVQAATAERPGADLSRSRVLNHASAAEIARALARIGAETVRDLRPTRPHDLNFAIRYLGDYPEPFHGTLGGLVNRAILWHRRANERERLERLLARLGGPDRKTARPPIALPAVPGVRFLGTVGAVIEEGIRMKHCIATRAEDAIAGRAYLFHVDYEGSQASVEVSATGKIVDAEGPANSCNLAVRWGAAQLQTWGDGLRRQGLHSPRAFTRVRRARAADPNQLTLAF